LIIGTNSGESNFFNLDILLNPSQLIEIDATWDDFYGPFALRERQSLDEVTPEDIILSELVREHFFGPDGIIELAKLDKFSIQYSDALFKYVAASFHSRLNAPF